MNAIRYGIAMILLLSAMMTPVAAAIYFTASAPGIITKGDPFTVSGTGAVNGTVAIWIVGRDHFEILNTLPDRNGNFSVTIRPSLTEKFASGQYAVIFQDPGRSGVLEIEGGTDVNNTLVVMNKGKIVSRLGHRSELGENVRPAADKILSVASLPGVDDIFLARYFFVEEPAIFFTRLIPASGFRLPDKIAGEPVMISGTTNLGAENVLVTEVRSWNSNDVVTKKTIPVTPADPMNTWVWDLDAPGLPPGNYELVVISEKSNTTARAIFSVIYPVPPSSSPGVFPAAPAAQQENDYTFPVFIAATLIVLAIVLYFAGKG